MENAGQLKGEVRRDLLEWTGQSRDTGPDRRGYERVNIDGVTVTKKHSDRAGGPAAKLTQIQL